MSIKAVFAVVVVAFAFVGSVLWNSGNGETVKGRRAIEKANYGDVLKFEVRSVTLLETAAQHDYYLLKMQPSYGKISKKGYDLRMKHETQEVSVVFPAAPKATIQVGDILYYSLSDYIAVKE